MLRFNFSAKNPPLRYAADRYGQCYSVSFAVFDCIYKFKKILIFWFFRVRI